MADRDVTAEAAGDHIRSDRITEAVKEIGAEGDECHVHPGFITEEVGKLLKAEFLGDDGFMSLFGEQTAGHGHEGCDESEGRAEDGILMLLRAADEALEVRYADEGDETHGIGADHTEGGELVPFVRVLCHDVEQRTIRHVDHGIAGHHEQVEAIGPDTLAGEPKFRREEQEGKDDTEGYRTEDEPWTVGAPAGLGSVGNRAHEWVRDDIKHAGDEHEYARVRESEPEDIRKEHREGDGHDLPGDAAGSGITQSISYFFS